MKFRITPTGITWLGIAVTLLIIIGFIVYVGAIFIADDNEGYVGVKHTDAPLHRIVG